jgi:hypothetical protein
MLSLKERTENYSKAFPKYPPLHFDKRIGGIWMIGNEYSNLTKYYGAYPRSYLKRVMSLFPDCEKVLHLFSGSLDKNTSGIRFDINSDTHPDVVGDAHKLSIYFQENYFDLILADPPYSEEDANHYGMPMINRNMVLKECIKVTKTKGFIVWLDQVFPMFNKDLVDLVGMIGIVRSTNHHFRIATIFQKR